MQPPRKWRKPVLPARVTVNVAFVAIAGAALEQIGSNAAGAAAGRDPEYLHQLRVGVRRLRSALHAFGPVLRRRRAAEVELPWRSMMRILGEARDWDVFLATLAAGPLYLEAVKRRGAAQRRVRNLLGSEAFRDASSTAFAQIHRGFWRRSAEPSEPLASFARRALEKLHRGLRESAEGIDWRAAARRHRVRIRVKRIRYACDFFASVFPARRLESYLDGLRGIQDILGEMNDIAVQRAMLRKLVPPRSPLGVVRAEAVSRASLALREQDLIAALEPAWRAFETGRPFWRRPEAGRRKA